MATKKTAAKQASKAAAKKRAGTKEASAKTAPKSMPKAGKDPAGGLTAKGREYFAKKEGLHLRPGVQGPADTPEKMVRKGSFLRRHFANPRGPMKDQKGEPTRLALSAHAWGEPVPQTMNDAKHLAAEGHDLLEQYHAVKDHAAKEKTAAQPQRKAAKKSAGKAAAKKAGAKKAKKVGSGANA
ncbi:MAG: DUF6321 domain-containing protein [Janthinobacterium lividum]